MKRRAAIFLALGFFSFARMESQGRSYGGGRSNHGGYHGQIGHAGGVLGNGHSGYGFHPRVSGGLHFGTSYSGAYYRNRFYSPGFFSPFYWADVYSEPFIEAGLFFPEFLNGERLYYQKAPAPVVQTSCKDAWERSPAPNSVSQIMNRMFEQQCENRHPSPDAELRHPGSTSSPAQNFVTPPSTHD